MTDDPFRPARSVDVEQDALFPEAASDRWWREHWWGMPAYDQVDARPIQRIIVSFMTREDVQEFARRLDVPVTRKTDAIWFPPEVGEADAPQNWEWVDEA